MRASRLVVVVGGSAVIIGAGYAASPKTLTGLDVAAPQPSSASQSVTLVDGPTVNTQRGPVQMQIAVENGRIVRINGLAMGSSNPKTLGIVSEALPVLRERVLTAQTWDVEYASGASFFSPGFVESIRGAMERAGLVSGTQPVQQPGEARNQMADYSKPGPAQDDAVLPAWVSKDATGKRSVDG